MGLEGDVRTIATSMKLSIAWRSSMLLSILTGPLFFTVNYFVWTAIFSASGKETIGGFTLPGMITYLAISQVTLYLVWDDTHHHTAHKVRDGQFVQYLLKPFSYLRYQFLWKVGHRTLAFFIEFVPVVLLLTLLFGAGIYGGIDPLAYVLAVAIAFVITFLINFLIGMSAFWIVRTHGLFSAYGMAGFVLFGSAFPLTIYPEAVQRLLLLTPFPYVSYVPASIFLGRYSLGGITFSASQTFLYGGLQVAVLLGLCVLAWRLARHKFEGVGT